MTEQTATRPREFITASTVAQLIGLPRGAAFLRQRDRLEKDEGFPAPLPTSRRPMMWRRSAVEAWLDQLDSPAGPPPGGGNVVYLMREARR
ncbi:helix-turn-helix transcriptional regulator [Mameliella alba]|uniref:Putative transcriptional regulator n=1 Tax=Mameliella alba TaxID=561184 RepID=A0A0B3RQZ3_9RHOB|nr:hypothetical protein [Mameliella alba]KHQ50312.1 putative transcriptional regulator [Mameliella alba]OWV39426.1 hypothetical protein CDZ95_26225 [Mameliella alba]